MKGLCQCGCGQKTSIAAQTRTADGQVKGQPVRWIKGHNRRKSPVDFVIDESGCWVWQLALNKTGYGVLRHEGRTQLAHRTYYTTIVGPIPEGLELDHLCRNRACVNPDHLEPVTHAENSRRSPLMGQWHARKTHCKHGHPFDEENTRWTKRGHRICRACIKRKNAVAYARMRSQELIRLGRRDVHPGQQMTTEREEGS